MKRRRVLVIGEIASQRADGVEHIGGSALNVSHHLAKCGVKVHLVSRVGGDSRGIAALSIARRAGISVDDIQVDYDNPTGQIAVTETNGVRQIVIPPDQAWDFLDFKKVRPQILEKDYDFVVFGTLLQRSHPARDCLRQIVSRLEAPAFVDLNLRAPHESPEILQWTMERAEVLKLNRRELRKLAEFLGNPVGEAEADLQMLHEEFNLGSTFVTDGASGSRCAFFNGDSLSVAFHHHNGSIPPMEFKSVIGVGDAFTAAAIFGVMQEWAPALLLQRADEFARWIGGQPGAIPSDMGQYGEFVQRWQLDGPAGFPNW